MSELQSIDYYQQNMLPLLEGEISCYWGKEKEESYNLIYFILSWAIRRRNVPKIMDKK